MERKSRKKYNKVITVRVASEAVDLLLDNGVNLSDLLRSAINKATKKYQKEAA
jgi:post-segregation antitoxin (ccd killing protein)